MVNVNLTLNLSMLQLMTVNDNIDAYVVVKSSALFQ